MWLFVPKFSNANIGVILKFILATPDLKVSSSLVDILFTSCILHLIDWKKFLIAEYAVTVTSGCCGCVLLWDEALLKTQSNVCGSVNGGSCLIFVSFFRHFQKTKTTLARVRFISLFGFFLLYFFVFVFHVTACMTRKTNSSTESTII